jgi:hypothetical protein
MRDRIEGHGAQQKRRPFWLQSEFWLLPLPLLGLLAIIGIIALLFRSTGKW